MAIEFHCEHCQKMIRAADEHAGRRGKCPHCQNSVYIPAPADEVEPLNLAPVDETHERERQKLDEESRNLAQTIREARETPPETAAARQAPASAPAGDVRFTRANMQRLLIEYVQQMAQGNLSEAEALAEEIHQEPEMADQLIQQIVSDDIPPGPLAELPRPVLVGFFKQLREKG